MSASSNPTIIDNRYLIREQVGIGGMGVVYKATDRLIGQDVALKHVTTPPNQLMFASRADHIDLKLALAKEFRTLASLRHPYIISVLDYGFDESRRPFFTMDLLENPQTIVEASQNQPLKTQVELLVQTLLALAYLHRRGVLHRDIKPSNVMVEKGKIKVLDFGLSVITNRSVADMTSSTAGTIAYQAPEIFRGQPASRGSDFYAVGVMAYEIFSGHHPFKSNNLAEMVNKILNVYVDLTNIGVSDELTVVLGRLLAKTREERYRNAANVIRSLCNATNQNLPPETIEIRESYLSAARFVGRDDELNILTNAQNDTNKFRGSTWLIGGESGVGKSRLVDELRIRALVEGALVVFGYGSAEGGAPYSVWRDALRILCLYSELSDTEASVLKSILPDISSIIGKEVQDAPEIEPGANQDRLLTVVEDIFVRQQRPIVVILEDLHWASESLKILARLSKSARNLPLMLIGTYRIEERPNLPIESGIDLEAPNTHQMMLNRLSDTAIADLSASMLGEKLGRTEHIVDLLQRETEGNPFFIIEMVRSLAEEAGQLEKVGDLTLPWRIDLEGIQSIVTQRLEMVPSDARSLLEIAAVAGRQLDLNVLKATLGVDPGLQQLVINAWLETCSDAVIIEVGEGGKWRFTHDKLREGLLQELSVEETRRFNKQVAEAIEHVHPNDPEYISALAYHWNATDNKEKAAQYAGLAGEQALEHGAAREAIDILKHAIELGDDIGEQPQRQSELLLRLGEANWWMGYVDESIESFEHSAAKLGWRIPAKAFWKIIILVKEILKQVMHRMFPDRYIGLKISHPEKWRTAGYAFARMAMMKSLSLDLPGAFLSIFISINLLELAGPSTQLAFGYAVTGVLTGVILPSIGEAYFNRSLELLEELPLPYYKATTLEGLGIAYTGIGRLEDAMSVSEQGSKIAKEINHYRSYAEIIGFISNIAEYQGDFVKEASAARTQLELGRYYDYPQMHMYALLKLAISALRLGGSGHQEIARKHMDEVHELQTEVHSKSDELWITSWDAFVALRNGNLDLAARAAKKALGLVSEITPAIYWVMEGYAGPPGIFLALWDKKIKGEHMEYSINELRELAQRGCKGIHSYARLFPIGRPRAWLYQGQYDWLVGNSNKAMKAWARSLTYSKELKMPYEQGLAHYEIGRHLSPENPNRHLELKEALMIFEQLGTSYDAKNVRESLSLSMNDE